VAFVDCTDVVSVLTSHLKVKVFGECLQEFLCLAFSSNPAGGL
jgi:hypothetical protein